MVEALFELDSSSPVPLYRQVQDGIIHGIETGVFSPRRRLPSSRELADELELSRNTINLAYQELLAQGILVSQERRGIFVTPDLAPDQLRGLIDPPEDKAAPLPGIDWSRRLSPSGDQDQIEVTKPTDWHEYPYPFIPGQIELSQFPARSWNRCLRESLFKPHLVHSLQDSAGFDDPLLVEMIRTRLLPSRGVHAEAEEIMITVGTQHGLDLIASALLSPGSRVLMEDPGYLDTRHIMLRHQATVGTMPVDDHGAQVPAQLDGIDAIFLTPSHHHPTNVTMSIERRRAVLDAASRSGTVVVEDDYDAEFRYTGQPSPSIKALDPTGDVVHLGSFSKFLAPGLRLGFLVGPAPLLAELRHITRYMLRHPPGLIQRAMALFLESGDYHRTLRLSRDRMRSKWRLMTDGVKAHLPFETSAFPSGGVSLWVQGPQELDAHALQTAAARRGVLIELGGMFFADPSASEVRVSGSIPGAGDLVRRPGATLRLGFSAIPERSIPAGMRELGAAAREVLGDD